MPRSTSLLRGCIVPHRDGRKKWSRIADVRVSAEDALPVATGADAKKGWGSRAAALVGRHGLVSRSSVRFPNGGTCAPYPVSPAGIGTHARNIASAIFSPAADCGCGPACTFSELRLDVSPRAPKCHL